MGNFLSKVLLCDAGRTPSRQVLLPRSVWLGDRHKNRDLMGLQYQDIRVADDIQLISAYGRLVDPTPAPSPADRQETTYFLPIAFQQSFRKVPLITCLITGDQTLLCPTWEVGIEATSITLSGFVLKFVSPIALNDESLPFGWFATGAANTDRSPVRGEVTTPSFFLG
jgi:hypothetical protein